MAKPSKWSRFERFESPAYWVEFGSDGVLTFSRDLAGDLALPKGVALMFDKTDRTLAVRTPTKDDEDWLATPTAARQNALYVRPAMSKYEIKPGGRIVMQWDADLGAWTGKVS